MKIEILKQENIVSYKELIDECFGMSNDIEKYEQYCEGKSYTIFVAMDGETVIGSVTQYSIDLFTFSFQPCLRLFNVAVKTSHREQSIAKALLQYVVERAKLDGCKSISLTCLDTAHPARKLYESVGFEKTSSVKYEMNLCE